MVWIQEMCLVAPESPSEQARRVFQTFDPEDNGFIPDCLLEEVMKALDLVSEPEYYVSLMKSKLDPEGLGIVLLAPFLLEFFPDQTGSQWQGTMAEERESERQRERGYWNPRLLPCLPLQWPETVQPQREGGVCAGFSPGPGL
ncbi:unnamed protein product [Oncorhynchus mykiss]|uniref:Uncharacterized protein n=1 Tax=Oncorhynchus mykiss TaxID=8022 RepID=A0A060YCS3_ONCMY|nr:unnamed protein product [Oncorhynchus mykiss]